VSSILVISPVSSHPPQNGARRRIHSLLSLLKARGHRIHFVYTACEKVDLARMKQLMEADWDSVDVFPTGHRFEKTQGADYGLDDWVNPHLHDVLPALARRYGVTHCLTNYVFQSAYLDALPEGVTKILDTHDKLSRRHLFEALGVAPGFYHTTEAEELRGLARADVVLSIQDNEVEYFQRAGRPVVVVGHSTPNAFVEKRYTRVERLGYVGASNKFNIHSLEALIPAFIAHVRSTGSRLSLHVGGNVIKALQGRPGLDDDCVQFEGYVHDLGAFMQQIDLYVNPTLIGTGLKIKSVEALSHGVPVISTATGWDGLPGLEGFHDASDIGALMATIARIEREGFDTLTKLANFSRASFSEYEMNLEVNLARLFEAPRDELADWAGANPRFIGNRQAENPGFLRLGDLRDVPVRTGRPRIAHLVNPVRMPKTSDLYIAQPIVYRSMVRAREATRDARVTLVARRFAEDAGYQAVAFDLDLPLYRSARDLGITEDARKLPLLADVFSLDGLPDEITHVVYTNSDIGLLPHFYDFVADRIVEGHDALVINRRTLPKRFTTPAELTEIYAEIGTDHPGFDCFVVSREILEKCHFADTLVGVHLIGRVVLWNLIARAKKIGYFPSQTLTFHIGDDVPSKSRQGLPYIRHNLKQGAAVARRLGADPGGFADPPRIERFKRALHVSPGAIHGAHDPASEGRNVVMMHSLFRSGSTYIFHKVRRARDWTAYYEPFHEDLALFRPEEIARFRERHSGQSFRHAGPKDGSDWLFAEYEGLLTPGEKGVRGYDRRMSYMLDFEGSDAAVTAYVDGLVGAARTENLFLQFNRTGLRQDRMRRLFPQATHVYLSRNLRDIWGSYLSFEVKGVHGFLRNNLAYLYFNAQTPLMRALSRHVPVRDEPFQFYFHGHLGQAYADYSLEQHFLIHAALWHEARAQARENAELIIDLDTLEGSRLSRLETEAGLAAMRLPVAFADLGTRRYAPIDLALPPSRLEALEQTAREIVAEARAADHPDLMQAAPIRTE